MFLAEQVKQGDKGILSTDITVADLIACKGDIYHVFSKNYLKKNGLSKRKYNPIANYVYMQSEINIEIGDKAPHLYFQELTAQCNGEALKYGGINTMDALRKNLKMNSRVYLEDYEEFFKERRGLMAGMIKEYYFSL